MSGRSVKRSKHAIRRCVFNVRSSTVTRRAFFILVSDVGQVPFGAALKEHWAFKVFQIAAVVLLLNRKPARPLCQLDHVWFQTREHYLVLFGVARSPDQVRRPVVGSHNRWT